MLRIIIDCEVTDSDTIDDLLRVIEIVTGHMTDNVMVTSEMIEPDEQYTPEVAERLNRLMAGE